MTARTDRDGPDALPEEQDGHRPGMESEAALSGWDPYIVAITEDQGTPGRSTPGRRTDTAPGTEQPAAGEAGPSHSRKLQLVAWLQAHGARG